MVSYEIWDLDDLYDYAHSVPVDKAYLIDSAIDRAKDLSRDNSTTRYVVVLRDERRASTVRGFASKGSFKFAVDCKRCNGVCYNAKDCLACNGAGWKIPV